MPAMNFTGGYRKDFERLLTSFSEKNTLRLCEFVKIWQDMKFYQISQGLITDTLHFQVTEDIFAQILELFKPHLGVHTRVGAIYLLYAMYSIQPKIGVKARIRVNLAVFDELKSFVSEMQHEGHLEVVFIIHKLQSQQAFYFVGHTDYKITKTKKPRVKKPINKRIPIELYARCSTFNEFVNVPLLKDLEVQNNEYRESLKKISSKFKVDDNIYKDIKSLIDNCNNQIEESKKKSEENEKNYLNQMIENEKQMKEEAFNKRELLRKLKRDLDEARKEDKIVIL